MLSGRPSAGSGHAVCVAAISVVVMAYRNASTIVRAVRSVVDQADDGVEIVVVTSGGDDTAERVRREFPTLNVVESAQRQLPGGTRNRGIEATRGSVVAFLEGDCVAEPGWIETRRRLHAAGHPVVASAVTNGQSRSCAAWGFHFGLYGSRLAGRPAGWIDANDDAAHGCSFERQVLERIGRFDESLRIGEDSDAARAVGRLGIPIWFDSSVRTVHWGPRSLLALVRNRYYRGLIRGRTRGPVARHWVGVAGLWVQSFGSIPGTWRNAGRDRCGFLVSLPWWALGNASALIANQRAGRVEEREQRATVGTQ